MRKAILRGTLKVLAVLLALVVSTSRDRAAAESQFDLSATEVTILAPASAQVIGHGHYKLSHIEGLEVVEGENQYLDGEYDREEQSLHPSVGGLPPVLVKYQHQFFHADGSLQYAESLDARTGKAACQFFDSSVPDLREVTLEVPADTYSGSSQLMLVVGRLRQVAADITFHSFNCIPDPRIIPITATRLKAPVRWPLYPGELVKLEITPDLGWFSFLIAPFIPKIYAWFDPTDSFNYVGGQFDRFYKGRHILLVRTHDANPDQGSASPATQP